MTPMFDDDFRPSWWLKSPHLQSMLASSSLRRLARARLSRRLERDAEWVTLDCGDGVRLTGCRTAQDVRAEARGLAVLFHGWEGSTRSTYLLQTGARLLAEGWDVFRLNFRDHGGTHGLNREIFHSCRIDEVVGALRAIRQRYPARPLTLTGFSLGGNFALRAALRAPDAGVELARVIAVCPVIDPHSGLFQLEHAPRMYHDYFMWKWRRSLKLKQRAFDDAELFTRRDLRGTLRTLTEALVLRHTDFGSLDNYLDGYSLVGDKLAGLAVPTSILASKDDPVCPASDFADLRLPPSVELAITEHGGHCGFIRDWHLGSWAEDFIAERLDRAAPVETAVVESQDREVRSGLHGD
ncbi:MAG: Hydrolase, alpha/beta fold family functionally coupled to Phosphoribulokinase [Rhodanobacteraceae bacterium]|jgi:predicted alpha/beta-fold hydrolase|nr:MAG: Hydrolase, alpha/beta fold family functionally coupled to Phosphoribulokinase [Rhodanobacteraceae bacterium]